MPAKETTDTGAAALAGYDAVIDVRSPGEFAEDHVPGAINLPVLDDAERAEVGTLYVQRSKFLARRIGAALVSRNIARHLETALADKPAAFRPLIYCWRGGQRSGSMATVLTQVGWPVTVLSGGYQTYRRRVTAALYDDAAPLRVVLLAGHTGTGKTEVLRRLHDRGVQTLDLEALAAHRGSLFGAVTEAQPSQKLFESRLLVALEALDPARAVVVEAESSKIGRLFVPPRLWRAMAAAPRIELRAPVAARASYLAATYGEVVRDLDDLADTLAKLPSHLSREQRAAWLSIAERGEVEALAASLMAVHYDPAYARGAPAAAAVVEMSGLDAVDLDSAADAVASLAGELLA